jgi:hypothetical protein
MATRISLTYFGMSGEGATVREAKADAGRKLEALVKHAEHTRASSQSVTVPRWSGTSVPTGRAMRW